MYIAGPVERIMEAHPELIELYQQNAHFNRGMDAVIAEEQQGHNPVETFIHVIASLAQIVADLQAEKLKAWERSAPSTSFLGDSSRLSKRRDHSQGGFLVKLAILLLVCTLTTVPLPDDWLLVCQ